MSNVSKKLTGRLSCIRRGDQLRKPAVRFSSFALMEEMRRKEINRKLSTDGIEPGRFMFHPQRLLPLGHAPTFSGKDFRKYIPKAGSLSRSGSQSTNLVQF